LHINSFNGIVLHAADTAQHHKIDRREFHNEKVSSGRTAYHFRLWRRRRRKISFGVSATYPPFESMDANNQIVGFDIDLAKRCANRCRPTVPLPTTPLTA
jgi:arginine transport system substrate-binding protein